MTGSPTLRSCLDQLADRRHEQAWADLVGLVAGDMRRAAASVLNDDHLVDDALQEGLLYIRDHAGDCRAETEGGARAWVLRIAHTGALQVLRRQRSSIERDRAAGTRQYRKHEPSPDEQVADADMHQVIRTALHELPDRHREPLVMHFLGGLDYAAMGEALSCTAANARKRVHRGLHHLRARLRRVGVVSALGLLGGRIQAAVPAETTNGAALQALIWQPILHVEHQVAWHLPATATTGATTMVAASIIAVGLGAGALFFYSGAQAPDAGQQAGDGPSAIVAIVRDAEPVPQPAKEEGPAIGMGIGITPVAPNNARTVLLRACTLSTEDQPLAQVIAGLKQDFPQLKMIVDERVDLDAPVTYTAKDQRLLVVLRDLARLTDHRLTIRRDGTAMIQPRPVEQETPVIEAVELEATPTDEAVPPVEIKEDKQVQPEEAVEEKKPAPGFGMGMGVQ